MVVEDDDSTREGLVELFEDMGFEVSAAANGREALDLLHDRPMPCVILLDLMMPVMSGVEFRQHQLQEPTFAAVPVIIVSAINGATAANLGAAGHVKKPFDLKTLVSAVKRVC